MGSSKVVFIDLRKIFLQLLAISMAVSLFFAYRWWNEPYLIKFSSPELAASYESKDPVYIKRLDRLIKEAKTTGPTDQKPGRFYVHITSRRHTRTYVFNAPSLLYNKEEGVSLQTDAPLRAELKKIIIELKRKSPYGEPVPWPTVKQSFLINKTVMIRDLDSGIKIWVTRRGGYNLARIAPVNQVNKSLLKKIFGGKWSWKRRAVVVYLENKKIAACLAGMPQGKEQLFSLYFVDAGTNKSMNLANKMLIFKAAGQIKKMFKKTSPEEAILGALTAIDQQDGRTLNIFLTRPVPRDLLKKSGIISVTLRNLYKLDGTCYKAVVSASFARGPYNRWCSLKIDLKYNQQESLYQLNPAFLQKLLIIKNTY
ncbi:hypothetical protein [Thermincola ferriacetica]